MVISITSLGRSGLQDWLIQRVTAIILAGYFGFMTIYLAMAKYLNQLSHARWHALFENPIMKFFTLLVLLSLMAHAWIGFWTVSTDYLKPVAIRLPIQMCMMLFLFANLVWGSFILWSV